MGIPRDAIALYPWSCGFGWCPAVKTEMSATLWAHEAQSGLYTFFTNSIVITIIPHLLPLLHLLLHGNQPQQQYNSAECHKFCPKIDSALLDENL